MSFLSKMIKPNIGKLKERDDYYSIWKALGHSDPSIQEDAKQALKKAGRIFPDSKLKELLAQAYLDPEQPPVNLGDLLEKAGETGFEIVFSALQNPARAIRKRAAGDLTRWIYQDKDRGNRVSRALLDRERLQMLREIFLESRESYHVKSALSQLGPPGLEILRDGLKAERENIRREASEGLVSYARNNPGESLDILDLLADALVKEFLAKESMSYTRQAIARAIAEVGKKQISEFAVCRLWYSWRIDRDDAMKRALDQVGYKSLIPALESTSRQTELPGEWEILLKCSNITILAQALKTLCSGISAAGQKMSCSLAILEALQSASRMEDAECAGLALQILEGLGVDLSRAEAAKKEELAKERHEREVEDRIEQLKTGSLQGKIYPDMENRFEKENRLRREKEQAALWLARHAADSQKAADAMVAALSDKSVQGEIVSNIGAFGAKASHALPFLQEISWQSARPLTEADFSEQKELLGGLTERQWHRVQTREPVDTKLRAAAEDAIKKIKPPAAGA